jgi:hypothetical protein
VKEELSSLSGYGRNTQKKPKGFRKKLAKHQKTGIGRIR